MAQPSVDRDSPEILAFVENDPEFVRGSFWPDGMIRVSVRDRGPGIPDSFRDLVFEKFTQADTSDRRQRGGTGLGLSICRAIIEDVGGRIDFETEPGSGTTLFFDLPEHRGGNV